MKNYVRDSKLGRGHPEQPANMFFLWSACGHKLTATVLLQVSNSHSPAARMFQQKQCAERLK